MKKDNWKKEEIAEDFCFTCKDGGHLRVCDYKKCLKAYHPQCVDKDPSFLETDDRWTCGWHSCHCKKSSTFQCFCCPSSFCHSCVRSAEFVQVKKKTKGFCNNCLRLAKMIEEDRNVDSDGDEVDFSNTETYEFLFKDYWEIVKDQEGLTPLDVQAADALLKRGENFQNGSDLDKPFEDESISGPDDLEDDRDDGKSLFKGLSGKRSRMKTKIKKSRNKKAFNGWGSEELIRFLVSIGKDTKEPLTQVDVCEIVKDYVQSENLFHPNKKKRKLVVPDEKLRSLFRKKKLKYHKIFDLLKSHLSEHDDLSDEFSFSSEEDEGAIFSKKQRRTNSDSKINILEPNHCREKVLEQPKSSYASVIIDNIKLVYLKKSLILKLMKNPETFENKVVGCFVRVKNDPKDFYYLAQKVYQLGQVTGLKKSQQAYKLGETSSDIVLCISNFSKDIHLSMLSDDDFEEEECEDLRQLVKKGLFKRPTVAELEKKIRSVHEDIMNHWIDKEILKLQKQIDRANEKGWRRELHEYIDRRELLRTPEERIRLVKEIPEVIADTEGESRSTASAPLDFHGVNEGNEATYRENAAEGKPEGNEAAYLENAAERKAEGKHAPSIEAPVQEVEAGDRDISNETAAEEEAEGNSTTSCERTAERQGFEDASDVSRPLRMGEGAASHEKVAERNNEGNEAMDSENDAASHEKFAERIHEGNEAVTDKNDVSFHEKDAEVTHEGNEAVTCENGASSHEKVTERKQEGNGTMSMVSENHAAFNEKVARRMHQGNEAKARENVVEDVAEGIIGASNIQRPLDLGSEQESKSSNNQIIEIEEHEEDPRDKKTSEIQIIDLDEDDEDIPDVPNRNDPTTVDSCEEIVQAATPESHKAIWHYIDPSGNEQGPFTLNSLRFWMEEGYFDDDFKVWRSGQSQEDAILLTVVLGLAFP